MPNREQCTLAIVEDDMADVCAAKLAVAVLWQRIANIARRGYIRCEDIDCFSDELRAIEQGLETVTKYLRAVRRDANGL
jgi:hypothetical protein